MGFGERECVGRAWDCEWAGVQVSDPKDDRKGFLSAFAWRHRKYVISDLPCVRCGAGAVLAVCWRCVSVGGMMGSGRCRGCTGGDQTACVPTLASMGTRRFESWSIIWGKKNCIISPRWGAACRARCVQGEVQAVAPCDLSRSRAPHHSPPTAWFKGRCGVKGGHSVGCDPGARCTWGARWVEGG